MTEGPGVGATFEMDLDATPEAGQAARNALRDAFPEPGDWSTQASLLGVVSELVAHRAVTAPGSAMKLRVELGVDGRFRGTLEHLNDEAQLSSIALALVDGLSESWGRSPGAGRTWFVVAPPGAVRD